MERFSTISYLKFKRGSYNSSWSLVTICVAMLLFTTLIKITDSSPTSLKNSNGCTNARNQSQLNSFLWMVKRDPPSYFFGTIHVPYTRVWDYIPQNTKIAFRRANNVFFELDLTDHATAAALADCQLLEDSKTIADVLPRSLYKRIKRHMEYVRRKIPDWMNPKQRSNEVEYYADYQYKAMAGSWNRMKPVWLMLTLNSLTESDVKSFGIPVLDLYLSRQAMQWGKKTGAIEKVEEQCNPLNKLSYEQVLFALNQTLTQHETARKSTQPVAVNDDLIEHYNCGDLNSILFNRDTAKMPNLSENSGGYQSADSLAKQLDDYFQRELLYKRNMAMADRIVQLLNEYPNKSFFFAFGAGHFLGNHTIIDRVASKGFTVEHLAPDSKIPIGSRIDPSQDRPFTRMDTSLVALSHPYIEALAQLTQIGSGNPIRHRNGKRRKSERKKKRDKIKESSSFTKLWVRIDEEEEDFSEPFPQTPPAHLLTYTERRVWERSSACYITSSVTVALFSAILIFCWR